MSMKITSREVIPQRRSFLPESGSRMQTRLCVEDANIGQIILPDVLSKGSRPIWLGRYPVDLPKDYNIEPIITYVDNRLVTVHHPTGNVLQDHGHQAQFIPGIAWGDSFVIADGRIQHVRTPTLGQVIDSETTPDVDNPALLSAFVTAVSNAVARHDLRALITPAIEMAGQSGIQPALELYRQIQEKIDPRTETPIRKIFDVLFPNEHGHFQNITQDKSRADQTAVLGKNMQLVVRFLANCSVNAYEAGDMHPVVIFARNYENLRDMILVLSHTEIDPELLNRLGQFGISTKNEGRGTGLASVATIATNQDAGLFALSQGQDGLRLRRLTGFQPVDYDKFPIDYNDGTQGMRAEVVSAAQPNMKEFGCKTGFAIVYPH